MKVCGCERADLYRKQGKTRGNSEVTGADANAAVIKKLSVQIRGDVVMKTIQILTSYALSDAPAVRNRLLSKIKTYLDITT